MLHHRISYKEAAPAQEEYAVYRSTLRVSVARSVVSAMSGADPDTRTASTIGISDEYRSRTSPDEDLRANMIPALENIAAAIA